MKRILTCSALVLVAAAPVVSRAQMGPGGAQDPPKVLYISREEIKSGMGAAHIEWEKGWPAAYGKVNYPTPYLAMTSMSGSNEAWYLIGYPSWDAMEKDNEMSDANTALTAELQKLSAGDGQYLAGSRSVIAEYVPELSYRPKVDLSKMHYMEVRTFRARPGHDADFVKAAAMFVDAFTKANIDAPWAIYHVITGMPAPTYLVIWPMRSLSRFDRAGANYKAWSEKMGPDGMAAMNKMTSDGTAFSDDQIFSFSPPMSYVSKAFKAGDPGFWK
jgi:hypothetical protein